MFHTIVTVDWSARSRPALGADSIWVCVHDVGDRGVHLDNPPTRRLAAQHLRSVLVDRPGPTLVAIDVALGYPSGFAASVGLTTSTPWLAVWELLASLVEDGPDNTNNRFEVASGLNAAISSGPGPFWGTAGRPSASLHRTKGPGFPHHCRDAARTLDEWRATEHALRARRLRPASVWQLTGAGSVGSQTLTALPVLASLRDDPALDGRIVVWPFETGLVDDPTGARPDAIVVAEAWPSAIPVDWSRHPVRDAAQVLCLAEHLADLDRQGGLGAWFAPDVPHDRRTLVTDEEGWVLGTES